MNAAVRTGMIELGVVAASCLFLAGCGKPPGQESARKRVISNCGSDTMVNLAQMWAEEYRKVAPDVSVEVSGGGSGVGIRDLASAIVDIANSSRDITDSEKQQALKNTGREPKEWKVGADAIAIYVHKDNPVESLSYEQLVGMFAEDGRIERWSQVGVDMSKIGGRDEIIRVSRQNNSGTYAYFREKVLKKKDFKLGSLDMSGSKDVVELVARTKSAIGYSGMGYRIPGVKMVRIVEKAGEPPCEPSLEAVRSGKYPLSRPLYMYTLGEPQGYLKAYLDWVLSPAGQAVVEQTGFVSNTSEAGARSSSQ